MRAARLKLRDAQGRCDKEKPKLDQVEESVAAKIAEAEEKGGRVDTAR